MNWLVVGLGHTPLLPQAGPLHPTHDSPGLCRGSVVLALVARPPLIRLDVYSNKLMLRSIRCFLNTLF